jgi:hypothetical protein
MTIAEWTSFLMISLSCQYCSSDMSGSPEDFPVSERWTVMVFDVEGRRHTFDLQAASRYDTAHVNCAKTLSVRSAAITI